MHYAEDTPELLKTIWEQTSARLNLVFNHVMLNQYANGGEYIGRHRDTKENGVSRAIFAEQDSLTRPATGHCESQPWRSPNIRYDAEQQRCPQQAMAARERQPADHERLDPGQLEGSPACHKGGQLSLTCYKLQHEIPREPKVQNGRISLTFRQMPDTEATVTKSRASRGSTSTRQT